MTTFSDSSAVLSSIYFLITLFHGSTAELFSTLPNATLSEFLTEDVAPVPLNKPQNSDVIVGEDVAAGSNLLLTCTAPYPVQWVYTGDGRPVLSTNTSVKFLYPDRKAESQLDFTAFALISSPKEKNTGNYTCRSLQDPRVAVSYFIFVPGPNIFTSSGGQELQYSRSDPSIRIPCSVSHPRALVGLQKSENGLLNCPLNDSISYDPKTGFHLKSSDFPDPSGKYICTAAYNNTVRYIEFNLTTQDSPDDVPTQVNEPPSPSGETYCDRNSDCPDHLTCSSGMHACTDPCKDLCGISALCNTINHIPTCSCPANHSGDPYYKCTPASSSSGSSASGSNSGSSSSSNPCQGAPCGPNGLCKTDGKLLTCVCKEGYVGTPPTCSPRPCKSNNQCPEEFGCVQGYCRNPCDSGVCGRNAQCRIVNQNPVCYCSPGMVGDPFDECRPIGEDLIKIVNNNNANGRNPCDSISCGHNAECSLSSNGRATCRCKPGYNRGDAYTACYREEPSTPTPNPCSSSPCGPNTVCRDTKNGSAVCTCMPDTAGNPYIGCRPKSCSSHQECSKNQMCMSGKCQDPCSGPTNSCGLNTVCKSGNHNYRCSCQSGFAGDPARQCYPNDQPSSDFNPCNPNPCGKNAECLPHRGRALCRCPQPLYGDPLVSCSMRCTKTSECPNDQVCYAGNRTCADPCLIYDPGCGNGAACVVKNHSPSCVCPVGTKGDPYTRCSGQSKEPAVPCYPLPCGENAVCILPQSGSIRQQGVCACSQGYVGDPYAGCQQGERCSADQECSSSRGCLNGRCLNPCKFQGVCGINQECIVRSHKPTCICKPGYPVNSNGNCYKDGGPSDNHGHGSSHNHGQAPQNSQSQTQPSSMPTSRPPSRPSGSGASSCSVCGPYSECQISQGIIACSCKTGTVGRPPNCRPECQYDGDCAFDKACIQYKCQDPCIGACGRNALCRVRQRTPVCSCPKGYYGSPLHECKCCSGSLRTDQTDPESDDYIVDESLLNLQQQHDQTFFPLSNQHHQLQYPTILIPLMTLNHTGFELIQ